VLYSAFLRRYYVIVSLNALAFDLLVQVKDSMDAGSSREQRPPIVGGGSESRRLPG